MNDVLQLQLLCESKWRAATYLEQNVPLPRKNETIIVTGHSEYMFVQTLYGEPGDIGRIQVVAPNYTPQPGCFHSHPAERVMIIMAGSATVMVSRANHPPLCIELVPGHKLWLPRDTPHMIMYSSNGLLWQELQSPWIDPWAPEYMTKLEMSAILN